MKKIFLSALLSVSSLLSAQGLLDYLPSIDEPDSSDIVFIARGSNLFKSTISSIGRHFNLNQISDPSTIGDTVYTYTNENLLIDSIFDGEKQAHLNVRLRIDGETETDYTATLPAINSISRLNAVFYGDYSGSNMYAIQTQGEALIRLGDTGRFTTKYFLGRGEVAIVTKQGDVYHIQVYQSPMDKFFMDDFIMGAYYDRSSFSFKGASYSVSKSAPPGVNNGNLFVAKVRDKAPFGENLLFKSNRLGHGSLSNSWSINRDQIRSSLVGNADFAPDGSKTAAIFPLNGVDNFQMQQIISDVTFDSLEYVTLSFYTRYRGLGTGIIDRFYITDRAGFVASSTSAGPVTVDSLLQRYSFTVQMTRVPTTPSVVIAYKGEVGDTFTVTCIQLERELQPSVYKPTGATVDAKILKSDSLFASLDLVNSFVDLNGIYRPTDNDDELLRQAIAYCEGIKGGGGACEGVVLADGMEFTEGEILIPEEFTLKGRGRHQTKVYANMADSTKSLFIFRDDPGAYVSRIGIENFSVEAIDTTAMFFECRHTFDVVFDNVGMNGNDMTDHLIKIGESGQIGALTSTIRECFLQRSTVANILYERCGNLHRIEGGTSGRSFAGVACYTDIASLTITGWDAEDNNMAFDFGQASGGRIAIEGYFEQKSGASERDFEFGTFESISFRDCFLTMDRWGFGENPGAISFDGCSFNTGVVFESIQESPLYRGHFLPGPTWEPNSLSVTNSSFVRSINVEKLRATFGDKWWFHFDGGISTDDGGNYGMLSSVVNNLESEESRFINSSFEGIIGGQVGAANLSFVGADENLVVWSDSSNIVDDAQVKVYLDAEINPITGDTTFEVITSKIDNNDNKNLARLYLEENIQPGDPFTISFYAKSMSDTTNSSFRIFADEGAGVQGIVSRDYRRYTIVVDSSSAAYNSLLVQYRGRAEGDSIAIGGWQVNRGRKATPHVPTFGEGSLSGGAAKIAGDIEFTGHVKMRYRPSQYTAEEALNLTPINGDLIYITSVNDIFPCIGFWGYESGRWVKL